MLSMSRKGNIFRGREDTPVLSFIKYILFLVLIAVCLFGCGRQGRKKASCIVVLEDCEDAVPDRKSAEADRGNDISFTLTLKNGCVITGTDYGEYDLAIKNGKAVLMLKDVRYSTIVRLYTTYECRTYFPNGGEGDPVRVSFSEQISNTLTEPFIREGYLQSGWNTKPDGSGEYIGFGSRCEEKELYAQWEKETEESDFAFICTEESAIVTGYHGQAVRCVLPDTLGGKTVRVIRQGAFANAEFTEFVCSDTVQTIEAGAFENSRVEAVTLFDNLLQISDESFRACPVRTLYLNARRAPVYAGSYFSAFPDKCERLFSRTGKKIVLFSGSSGRYGYDSQAIDKAFTEYDVVNMGTYAYTNARPQLDIIRRAMNAGDILIEAPEFDAAAQQFCESDELDRFFFSLTETDYKLITFLDLRTYTGVFDALNEYLYEHGRMEERDYSYLPAEYDDDGNRIDYPTYNEYGDYILKRPNSERDEMHRMIPADYTTDTITARRIKALDWQLAHFTEKGVTVLFTYTPRNRSSLTEKSTPERIRETETLLKQSLSVPVISHIEESLYSGIYFYEIDNHLSDEGVVLRTDRLIADLAEWLGSEDKNQ
ncbi:UNVERIFIED_CONTAM: leucine rich repeat (LRR) protein [Murimonas intestini]|uniref:Leucine rich repeat (LRR) protein n=2 Tax=Murimonas intestini TaxID=1337051 RepID=A0AB73TAH3_9FIRM